jgi:diacylglycerol kinase family enzyme
VRCAQPRDQLPDVLGPESAPLPLRFAAPDGTHHSAGHALLISNNAYRLGLGYGAWRPHLDTGSLGVLSLRADGGRAVARLAVLELFRRGRLSPGYDRWTTGSLTVQADGPVTAALDGEPAILEPLLQFTGRRGALLVRLPAARPRPSTRPMVQESQHLITAALGRRPPSPRP